MLPIIILCLFCCQFTTSLPQIAKIENAERCDPSSDKYVCGVNTKCRFEASGRPICRCITPMYTGSPLEGCRPKTESELGPVLDVCSGTCAPHATCQIVNEEAECTCPDGFVGDGFSICTPECSSHADCPGNLACIGRKCGDPCYNDGKGICGKNAECRINQSTHKAICKCPSRWKGHPFEECHPPS